MDRLFVLHNLRHCLSEAAAERNWAALMRVDGAVATTLTELAGQGGWSALERSAMEELKLAHREASELCARELSHLAQRLSDLRARHGGWRAYAASSELEERS